MRQRRGVGRRGPGTRAGQWDSVPASFCVVDPGHSRLRLLVAEASAEGATVWGWAETASPDQPNAQWWADSCGLVLHQAEQMAHDLAGRLILPDRIVVGLSGSQVLGWAGPISQRRSQPERPVEEQELEALLGRALRLAVHRLQGKCPNGQPWMLVDAAPVALAVDGRGVTDPVGFRCQELGATVFAALAAPASIETWKWVGRQLEFSELTLGTTPLALAEGFRDPQDLLVDVGGGTTQLTMARGGRPLAFLAFPLGGAALSEALMRRWHVPHDRAEELKHAYAGGKLAAEARLEVQEALLPTIQSWLQATEAALEQMNQDEPLPQQILMTGGGTALPEVVDSVRALAWSRRLRFRRYPEVRCIRPGDIPGVVNRTELGREPGDVAALALAAWTARQSQPIERPARILAALCQP
jgi:cell division protein FtsA